MAVQHGPERVEAPYDMLELLQAADSVQNYAGAALAYGVDRDLEVVRETRGCFCVRSGKRGNARYGASSKLGLTHRCSFGCAGGEFVSCNLGKLPLHERMSRPAGQWPYIWCVCREERVKLQPKRHVCGAMLFDIGVMKVACDSIERVAFERKLAL